jgi:hypothetical protein
MIGSEGEIDFAGFLGSATVSAAANFGILFSPIRSVFITRKAYKYFLGIIKQTIRRNLLVIQLNFDQFENLILQKSFEAEEDSEFITKIDTLSHVITSLTNDLCDGKNQLFKGTKNKALKDRIDSFKKAQDALYRQHKASSQSNPFRSLWEDQHNNTYTRTLEQIKQYINEDSQKELDALKNSINKMAGNDVELGPYGELLIAAAEEYAIKTNHGINNNFIKMSSVFNLENQKKLIQLIVDAQKEEQNEIEKKKKKLEDDANTEKINESIKKGKEIYEKTLKNSTKEYTFDMFEKEFGSEGIEELRAFFRSDEGKEAYEEFIKKNPLYKYFILDSVTLNNLLNSINDLEVVEISDTTEFFDTIVKKEYALYYMMADRSLKDAIESVKSVNYFGFNIPSGTVENNILQSIGDINLHSINESIDFEYIFEADRIWLKRQKSELFPELSNLKKQLVEYRDGNEENKEEIQDLIKQVKDLEKKLNYAGKTYQVEEVREELEKLKKKINNYINLDEDEDSDSDIGNSDSDSDMGDSDSDMGDSDSDDGDSDSDDGDSDSDDGDSDSDSDDGDSDSDDGDSDSDSDGGDSDSDDGDSDSDSDGGDSDSDDGDSDSDSDGGDSDSDGGDSDSDGGDSDSDGGDSDSDGGDSDSDDGDSDSDDGDSDSEENHVKPKSLSDLLFPKGDGIKKRYFLTFNGSGDKLFDILHNDFKTTIFTEDKNYVSDISADSKLTIFKLIHEQLKMGKAIASKFANYLVRLEAHMLLKDKKPWFVVKNNEELIKKQECFDIDAKKIQNKKAFVEISKDDFIDIKKFLERFHSLSENDFSLEENNKKEENK